jgi:hypothetical protein
MTDARARGRAPGCAPATGTGATKTGRTRRRGPGGQGLQVRYSGDLAEEICARLAGGQLWVSMAGTTGMPAYGALYDWMRKRPAFAEAVVQARAIARSWDGETEPTVIEPSNLAELHEEPRDFRRQLEAPSRQPRPPAHAVAADASVPQLAYDPALVARICEELARGETWTQLSVRNGFPSYRTLYNWMAAYPEADAMVREARRIGAEAKFEKALDVAMDSVPANVQSDRLRVSTLLHHAERVDPGRFGGKGGEAAVQTIVIKRFERVRDETGQSVLRVIEDVQDLAP